MVSKVAAVLRKCTLQLVAPVNEVKFAVKSPSSGNIVHLLIELKLCTVNHYIHICTPVKYRFKRHSYNSSSGIHILYKRPFRLIPKLPKNEALNWLQLKPRDKVSLGLVESSTRESLWLYLRFLRMGTFIA